MKQAGELVEEVQFSTEIWSITALAESFKSVAPLTTPTRCHSVLTLKYTYSSMQQGQQKKIFGYCCRLIKDRK